MRCPSCGSTIDPPGSRICKVCNAYQPRVRRKAYILLVLIAALFAFEVSPYDYALYTVPTTIAVVTALIIVLEVLIRAKERGEGGMLKTREI